MFKEQTNYLKLRRIVSERSSSLILWVGSGLSKPAGMPDWSDLKKLLIKRLDEKILHTDNSKEKIKLKSILESSKTLIDYWRSIELLAESLGATTYDSYIRSIFDDTRKEIPKNYKVLSKLNFGGVITLNIDNLFYRAIVKEDKLPTSIKGTELDRFLYALSDSKPFILNLHGIVGDRSTWVFGKKELLSLQKSVGYNSFINNCINSNTVIFIGINVSDVAIKSHFERINCCDHTNSFWITSDRSKIASDFCEKYKILPIYYSSDNEHKELEILIEDIIRYVPKEEEIKKPVLLGGGGSKMRNFDDIDLSSLDENELREVLNKKANSIIRNGTEIEYARYSEFIKKNLYHIHKAWYVDLKENNILFNYKLKGEKGEGAFGDVYRAENKDMKDVAIKVLKFDLIKKEEFLQSFRRGVRAMQILSESNIPGIVKFLEASEIPAFVAMEMIEGLTLKDAVKQRHIIEWCTRIDILLRLSLILKRAHGLPQIVLHRDLRPSNIILKNYFCKDDEYDVVLLDFDLAWHKGSMEKSVVASNVTGFLAPEQITNDSKYSTRNALVDSFGIGMLAYYIISYKEPLFSQNVFDNWEQELNNIAINNPYSDWRSLPFRMMRLVYKCTRNSQPDRIDMHGIVGELTLLSEALNSPDKIQSPEIIADEIIVRVAFQLKEIHNYFWNIDKCEGCYCSRSGMKVALEPDKTAGLIKMFVTYRDSSGSKGLLNKIETAFDEALNSIRPFSRKDSLSKSVSAGQSEMSIYIESRTALSKIDELRDIICTLIGRLRH